MSDYDWRYIEDFELPEPIKVRKDHKCDNCNVIIKKGELAIYQEGRSPTYSEGDYQEDIQTGIYYWKSYIHEDSSICDKANKEDPDA